MSRTYASLSQARNVMCRASSRLLCKTTSKRQGKKVHKGDLQQLRAHADCRGLFLRSQTSPSSSFTPAYTPISSRMSSPLP